MLAHRLAAFLLATASLAHAADGFVQAKGRWLVDPQGRVLILHGVNVANASKRPPYLPWQTRAEFEQIARWGLNSVRLLTVWAALEPEPGTYDDAYIERLAERVRWCRELGLMVVLDMHQDLYSEKYRGDGAPPWACLDDGLAMGPWNRAWFLNYLQPPVLKAFDRFWANAPGPGGVGIQGRFAAAWAHLARRFRDEPTVIGYDILNEPFPGSAVQPILLAYGAAVAKVTSPETRMKLLAALASPEPASGLAEVAAQFRDPRVAQRLIAEGGGPVARFERQRLVPFASRVVTAIRQVDRRHPCFIEPTPIGAVRTGLARPSAPSGEPHTNIVFAPHYYEGTTELRLPYAKDRARLRMLVGLVARAARQLEMPLWVGEWGNIPAGLGGGRECIRDCLDAFNTHLAGWCYWEYGRTFPKLPHLDLLTRPYPQAVAGVPARLRIAEHELELRIEKVLPRVPTVVWLPPDAKPEVTVELDGKATWRRTPTGSLEITSPTPAAALTLPSATSPRKKDPRGLPYREAEP